MCIQVDTIKMYLNVLNLMQNFIEITLKRIGRKEVNRDWEYFDMTVPFFVGVL